MNDRRLRFALPLAAMLALAACGGEDDAADAARGDDAAADTADAAAGDDADAVAVPDAPAATPALDEAAIDAVVRGVERENAMLADIAERMSAADDDAERLALMTRIQPATLESEGADAAGLEVTAYRSLKDRLFTVVGMAEMRAAMEQQFADIDTTGMDPEMAAQAEKNAEEMRAQLGDPYEGLDAAAADAIRARMDALSALRANHIGLLFKAAGG